MGTIAAKKQCAAHDEKRSVSETEQVGSALLRANKAALQYTPMPLKAKESLYRASFEQAAVGILHTSLDGRILECNGCFARIVGYTPQELVGLSFQVITPPEDRGAGNTAAARLLSGEIQTVSFEKRYLRKDGALTWVMLTISTGLHSRCRSTV